MQDQRTYAIIGAAMEVHKELGSGFLEAVYQEALQIEFARRNIPHVVLPDLRIKYKDVLLKKYYQPDFVCYNEIIVEIKALSSLSGLEEAQVINYLKASSLNLALLINFGSKSLEYKRLIYTN